MKIKWIRFGVCKWTYVLLACCGNILISSGQVSKSIVIPNEFSDKIAEGKGAQIDGLHQFTYSSSQFDSIGDQEITIHSVALRSKLDGPGSSLDVVVPSIRISMGTFTKEMSQLSAVADNNRGVDFTRVFFKENVGLHFVPASDPDNFDLVFNLDTPFRYNPKNGQFILEWQATSFSGRPDARVDFAAYFPPQGPVYEATELGLNGLGYGGFIMQINYTAVPEPSPLTMTIMLGGLCLVSKSLSQRWN